MTDSLVKDRFLAGLEVRNNLDVYSPAGVLLGKLQRWAFDDNIELSGEKDIWLSPGSGKTIVLNARDGGAVYTHGSNVVMVDTWLGSTYATFSPTGHNMAGKRVANVGAPTADTDALSPKYVTGRNKVINGDFSVNQRGSLGIASGNLTGQFIFDRWRALSSGGSTNYLSETPANGELPESAKNIARLTTSGQSATGHYAVLSQRIESVRTLSGKTATVSFWAKAGSASKVSVEFTQGFGSGGSAVVGTYAGQVTLSTTWNRYSITVAIPSLSGKTITAGSDDYLEFNLWTSAGSDYNARTGSLGIQNVTIDFWGVQVEEGPVASAFEQRPSYEQLRACQRYFNRMPITLTGYAASAAICRVGFLLPVPMRITPTIAMFIPGTINCLTANPVPTSITVQASTTNQSVYMDANISSSTLTPGQGVIWNNAYLDFIAEY